jgi:hypothetical protein
MLKQFWGEHPKPIQANVATSEIRKTRCVKTQQVPSGNPRSGTSTSSHIRRVALLHRDAMVTALRETSHVRD